MNNGQLDISTVILAVLLALIGGILFLTAIKKKKPRLHFWGVGLIVAAGVLLFVKSTELREILTALAAVFAVFIAAISIDQTKRLRQDSLDRENRDRNERLINEIVSWAINVLKSNSDLYNVTESNRIGIDLPGQRSINELKSDVQALRDEGKYIKNIAIVGGETVNNSVSDLWNELTSITSLLDTIGIVNELGADSPNLTNVEEHREKLAPLCNKIIDEATQAKVDFINK